MAYNKTKRLSTIRENSRQTPSPRRRASKRKIEGNNGYGMEAEPRIGYNTTRNKNRALQKSLRPRLGFPLSTHKQNLNLLSKELNKYKPKYTFKGLGKRLGIRI
jgi:hypothetical protein